MKRPKSNFVGPEIAGGLARFWAGGQGPSHASIGSAFALAGFQEPDDERNKEQRVLHAVRKAEDEVAIRLIEELLGLLRGSGVFERDASDDEVRSLRKAFERRGFSLTPEGFVDWNLEESEFDSDDEEELDLDAAEDDEFEMQTVSIPDNSLLISALRRLPTAVRPILVRRRGRTGISFTDEYDLQDAVELLLRSLYHDVRVEERTPSYAGSSSVMDFLLKDEAVAIEVKVTAPKRAEKAIKRELLEDIHDYQAHPSVQTMIAAIYDLHSTMRNPRGFENDLSKSHGSLDVQVVVVGWLVSPTP